MKYPYPIKNWRQSDEYPTGGNELNADEWAWEFTRRNPDYQQHWDIFKNLPNSSPEVGVKNGKWKGDPWLKQVLENYHGYVSPPALRGETYEQYIERNSEIEYCVESYQDFFIRKFGAHPTDPQESNPEYVFVPECMSENYEEYPREIHLPSKYGLVAHPKTTDEFADKDGFLHQFIDLENFEVPVVLAFDLGKEIGPQLKLAEEILKSYELARKEFGNPIKKTRTRRQEANFGMYLRILDARAVDEDWEAIAAALYPHEDNGYPNFRVTKKLKKNFKTAMQYTAWFPRN
ncbi:MAG: hypothetical protein CMK89_22320 [Pseudomonadales bacterium]|nr:hypothetical protein [Pseudomonadales bacterium]